MEKNIRYIIPKNYDFKAKLFGLIEYRLALFISGLTLFLILIFQNINIAAILKIQIIIIIDLPIIMIGTIGIRGENLIEILKILILYLLKQKVYFYEKSSYNFY